MKQTAIKVGKVGLVILAIPIVLYLMVITVSLAHATTSPNLSVCHPNNGVDGAKGGWSLISPDQASRHIDEDEYNKTPQGEYWKHEAKDGRHDVYADAQGNCPTVPEVDVCDNLDGPQATVPDNHTLNGKICTENDAGDYTDGKDPLPPVGCKIGRVVHYNDPETQQDPVCKDEVENTTPNPVTTEDTEVFYGK